MFLVRFSEQLSTVPLKKAQATTSQMKSMRLLEKINQLKEIKK